MFSSLAICHHLEALGRNYSLGGGRVNVGQGTTTTRKESGKEKCQNPGQGFFCLYSAMTICSCDCSRDTCADNGPDFPSELSQEHIHRVANEEKRTNMRER